MLAKLGKTIAERSVFIIQFNLKYQVFKMKYITIRKNNADWTYTYFSTSFYRNYVLTKSQNKL